MNSETIGLLSVARSLERIDSKLVLKIGRQGVPCPDRRAGVQPGELIAGEGLPVVWPKPDQLPKTPEKPGGATGPQA